MTNTSKIETEIFDFVKANDGVTEYKLCQQFICDRMVPRNLVKRGILTSEKIPAEFGMPGFNGKYGYKIIYHVVEGVK